MAARIEHVIARNVARLREKREWTQRDLAAAMSANGLTWSVNRVTQIETLRRPVSLIEIASLCWVFGADLDQLLDGPDDEPIELSSPDRPVSLGDLRAALRGDRESLVDSRTEEFERRVIAEDTAAARDELRRLGQKVGLTGEQLNEWSITIFNRRFLDERDSRAGDLSGASKRSAQTSRGHASRSLLAQVTEFLTDKDIEVVRRNLDRQRHKRRAAGDPR